jgi:hypothetical protein
MHLLRPAARCETCDDVERVNTLDRRPQAASVRRGETTGQDVRLRGHVVRRDGSGRADGRESWVGDEMKRAGDEPARAMSARNRYEQAEAYQLLLTLPFSP